MSLIFRTGERMPDSHSAQTPARNRESIPAAEQKIQHNPAKTHLINQPKAASGSSVSPQHDALLPKSLQALSSGYWWDAWLWGESADACSVLTETGDLWHPTCVLPNVFPSLEGDRIQIRLCSRKPVFMNDRKLSETFTHPKARGESATSKHCQRSLRGVHKRRLKSTLGLFTQKNAHKNR